jgi:hypothetical protein
MQTIRADEIEKDLRFPLGGIDLSTSLVRQSYKDTGKVAGYVSSCADGRNVRGWEQGTDRARGGARPGLSKYITVPVVASWVIQDLNVATVITG